MIIKRSLAFLTALISAASLASCSLKIKKSSSDDKSSETTSDLRELKEKTTRNHKEREGSSGGGNFVIEKDSAELDSVREHVDALLDALCESNNAEEVERLVNLLLDDYDVLYENASSLETEYFLDWNNEALEDKYDNASEDKAIGNSLINYAFAKGSKNEEYSHIFDGLTDEDIVEDLDKISLKRIEGYTRVEVALSDEQLDDYHDIAYSDDLDDDEKDLLCAELYLDILSEYDADSFYEQYYRDYNGEDILELCDAVRENLEPQSDVLLYSLIENDNWQDILYEPADLGDPFKVIQKYAPKLSEDIAKAADTIVNEKLYTIASGDDCFDGSFTDTLPASDKAFVYIYDDKDYNSLLTPVHEFGHYYATFYDDVPVFAATNNLDIAETQSQGFEFLFTQFYDDIYGDSADVMRIVKLYDMLYATLTGFYVGEFEYTVLKNKDTFTPEDVVDCWNDILGEYLPTAHLYMINHVFEQPGYYISYGVSSLAAFDIWKQLRTDPKRALDMYEKIAKISANDKDYQFRSALEKAGFSDVLNKRYIESLGTELTAYCADYSFD